MSNSTSQKFISILNWLKHNWGTVSAVIALVLGGGSINYSSETKSSNQTTSLHQGQQMADVILDIRVIERRLDKLEAHHE